MTKKISILIALIAFPFMNNCSHKELKRGLAGEKCEFRSDAPPLFSIEENNAEFLTVELGNFFDFFNLEENEYHLTADLTIPHQERGRVVPDTHLKDDIIKEKSKTIRIPVTATGTITFKLFTEDVKTPFWVQKIFVKDKKQREIVDEATIEQLAKKYAPVVGFADVEKFYPSSLEYVFNLVDVDEDLNKEEFYITNEDIKTSIASKFSFFSKPKSTFNRAFPVADFSSVLPFLGESRTVLKYSKSDITQSGFKKRFGDKNVTVYYSYFVNTQYTSVPEIIINYHFFYPYDIKNGTLEKPSAAAHIFDRESISVVVKKGAKDDKGTVVYYGAHLPSQSMSQRDSSGKILQQWKGGRVFTYYSESIKKSDRLYVAAAQGSHGIYPKNGNYAVDVSTYGLKMGDAAMLNEPAGGESRLIYPDFDSNKPSSAAVAYKLKRLPLGDITSKCDSASSLLAYSGSFVDVLGAENATFPPFTDREGNFADYADPNAFKFDMSK